jgi:hypothetical protein
MKYKNKTRKEKRPLIKNNKNKKKNLARLCAQCIKITFDLYLTNRTVITKDVGCFFFLANRCWCCRRCYWQLDCVPERAA